MTKLLQAERSRNISQTECGYLQFFRTHLPFATFQKSNSTKPRTFSKNPKALKGMCTRVLLHEMKTSCAGPGSGAGSIPTEGYCHSKEN